jgi:biopolymer transport protein ExbD
MKFQRNAKIFRGQLDAAPFLGVLFLVVIFLLLNSSFVFQPGIRSRISIDLPAAGTWSGVSNPTVAVAVDRIGRLFYENRQVGTNELFVELKKAVKNHRANREDLTLVVQADKQVEYRVMVELAQLARESGVHDLLEGTRPPPVVNGSAATAP